MKKLIYLFILSSTFNSCSNSIENKTMSREDSLMSIIIGHKEVIEGHEESINSFIKGFNEIQETLDIIKEKEKNIRTTSKDAETIKSKEDQIVADIQAIYDLMNKNKNQLYSLQTKLKNSTLENNELDKLITRLNSDIETKNLQIGDLRTQLELLNVSMTELHIDYKEVTNELAEKNKILNTAFYAFGTSKELIKNGVLTKEGGFIGIGKIQKMKADFNQTYFTQVEISKTHKIFLAAKKAKLITTHPSKSYSIEGKDGKAESINITDAEAFWSASKYLVIVVD